MTYEEAKKVLELMRPVPSRGNGKPFLSLNKNVALDIALETINKQISEKPKTVVEEYFGIGGKIHKSYFHYCPDCDTSIDYEDNGIYCPKCGKKINWSYEE